MDTQFLKDISEGKHIDNKEAWNEAKKLSAKYPIIPDLSELQSLYEHWNNVVDYSYLRNDRMTCIYQLILKTKDGTFYKTEVHDDGESCVSDFQDLAWIVVVQKEELNSVWVPK